VENSKGDRAQTRVLPAFWFDYRNGQPPPSIEAASAEFTQVDASSRGFNRAYLVAPA